MLTTHIFSTPRSGSVSCIATDFPLSSSRMVVVLPTRAELGNGRLTGDQAISGSSRDDLTPTQIRISGGIP